MNKDNGGPAFPQTTTQSYGGIPSTSVEGGMTLRQWYAGQAPPMPEQWFKDSPRKIEDPLWHWGEASAAWAFYYADAMIAEGNKS
jgi:hypothetical protein